MRLCYLSLIAALPILALAAACGGGGDNAEPTTTSAPSTAQPTATPQPAAETLALLRDGDIWLIDANGSHERRLTNLGNVQALSWVSRDELDVVAGADRSGHLLVTLSGEMRELSFPGDGSWSRDGLMYVVPVQQEIVVFDPEGAEVARPRIGPGLDAQPQKGECGPPSESSDELIFGQPAFSPDGQRVLLAITCRARMGATGNLYADLYEASLDGAVNRKLALQTNLRKGPVAARFSPDGAYIALAGIDQGGPCHFEYSVLIADNTGAGGRRLTIPEVGALHERTPALMGIVGGLIGYDWSPASQALVASFGVSVCSESGIQPFLAGLYVVNLDGSSPEKLTDGTTVSPAWSPSSRYIAFVAGSTVRPTPGPSTIRLVNLTTRRTMDLTTGTAPAWQPQP